MRIKWICGFFMIALAATEAQDLHHSQFYTSPLNTNPGLTGVFNGDYRAAINYRAQWFVKDLVRYSTISANADMKFFPKAHDAQGFWSAGLLFNYDQAGESRLSLAHIGLTGSYTRALNENNLFTLGALVGFGQRRFHTDDLIWDEQWVNGQYNPNADPMEDFSNTSNGFLDIGAGVNYRLQKSARTNLNLGLGVFHINQPDQTFFAQSATEELPRRWAASMMGSLQLSESIDIMLHGLFQRQGEYQEILVGGYGRLHVNQQRGKEFALLIGFVTRPDDALTPKFAIQYTNWYAGFSYDVNNSEFRQATNRRGGPEFSLVYRYTTVKPLPQFKNCPIF